MKPSLARGFQGTLPLTLSALCFPLVSCGGASPQEGVTPVQAHMFAHFDRAREVHDALVGGDLDRAKESAEWIVTHQDPTGSPGSPPEYRSAMRRYAGQVSVSRDLQAAASAAAHMGQACGDCHRANEVAPRFLIGTAPPGGSGPEAEMARHIWASERMWEGLVGPGDNAWRSGAEAIRGGWLDPQEVVSNPEDKPRIRELVRQVYDLGSQAHSTTDSEARAELYGAFLNTCNECHVLTAARIR